MIVSIFGLGHVGLVTAVCLASRNITTYGYDIDKSKVGKIKRGDPPFFEPQLRSLLRKTINNSFIVYDDPLEMVRNSDIIFITVDTPMGQDGQINLRSVRSVSKTIGEGLRDYDKWVLIVVKSTVLPGVTRNTVGRIISKYSGKVVGRGFGLVFNPEFLREGMAIEDTFKPDRIIIGEFDKRSGERLIELYRVFYGEPMPRIFRTSIENAELIKYANNAFLAMKVSFINMLSWICGKIPNANIDDVAIGIGLDKRIGMHFLKAGPGWGGGCWPKDLNALRTFSMDMGISLPLLDATLQVNELQPKHVLGLGLRLIGSYKDRTVAILGLSFKKDTDDIRNSISIRIVDELLRNGARVKVYDPKAIDNFKSVYGDRVEYASSIKEALKDSELLFILTDWDEFRGIDPDLVKSQMAKPSIVDAWRILDRSKFRENNIDIISLGIGTYDEG